MISKPYMAYNMAEYLHIDNEYLSSGEMILAWTCARCNVPMVGSKWLPCRVCHHDGVGLAVNDTMISTGTIYIADERSED